MDYKTQKLGCAFEIPQMQKANAKKDKKWNFKKQKYFYGLQIIEFWFCICNPTNANAKGQKQNLHPQTIKFIVQTGLEV